MAPRRSRLAVLGVFALPAIAVAGPRAGDHVHDDGGRPGPGEVVAPPGPRAQGTRTLYLNFDGAFMYSASWNGDDARDNAAWAATQFPELAGDWPAYPGNRSAVLQGVRKDYAAFDVFVTDVRPASGSYSMVMVGPKAFDNDGLGFAPIDCGDGNANNIGFLETHDDHSTAYVASLCSHELGHTFGLDHVGGAEIMNGGLSGDVLFKDQCLNIYGSDSCDQHQDFCPSGQQNSVAELGALFPAAPDVTVPTVAIASPRDGDVFDANAEFDVTVAAADDRTIDWVQLYANDQPTPRIVVPPYAWHVARPPAGSYAFKAIAQDLAGNRAESAVIVVQVNEPGTTATTGSGTSGTTGTTGTTGATTTTSTATGTTSSDSGTSDSGTSDSGDADSGDPWPETTGDFEPEGQEGGCACGVTPLGGPCGVSFLLIPLAGRRRRTGRR